MNPSSQSPRPPVTDASAWLALLENEWRRHRHALTGLLLFWIIGFWILLLLPHPAFHMVVCLLYCVLFAGPQAGADVMDGTEEFSFALPTGRGPLFLARMTPGLAFILIVGGLGGLGSAFDLPQKLWSLVFGSGLTEPFVPVRDRFWYPLSVCIPLAVYAITFSLAALAKSRGPVGFAWMLGALGTGAIIGIATIMENLLWRNANTLLLCPLLIATATVVLVFGHQLYLRKEATKAGGQNAGSPLWGWSVVVIATLLFLLVAMAFFARVKHVPSSVEVRPQPAPVLQRGR